MHAQVELPDVCTHEIEQSTRAFCARVSRELVVRMGGEQVEALLDVECLSEQVLPRPHF